MNISTGNLTMCVCIYAYTALRQLRAAYKRGITVST